jgi:hypothetical protein
MVGFLFLIPLIICFFTAIGAFHFMRVLANKRLPEDRRVPHFFSIKRWNRAIEEYDRFYPEGRAHKVWKVCIIGTAVCTSGMVLMDLWYAFMAN